MLIRAIASLRQMALYRTSWHPYMINLYMIKIKLEPMTAEKAKLLRQAARDWNSLMLRGRRTSMRRMPHMFPERRRLAMIRGARRAILNKGRGRIHHRLAWSAVTKGLVHCYPYTPTAFFVPKELFIIEGGHIWLRLFPRLELGFKWPAGLPDPFEVKIYLLKDGWYLNFISP